MNKNTRNEAIAIAKVMGWGYRGGYFVVGKKYYTMTNKYFCPYVAKLLQARMVEDGWNIAVHHLNDPREDGKPFMAYANKSNGNQCFGPWCDTEPAAIVELFCTVYGIKEDGE